MKPEIKHISNRNMNARELLEDYISYHYIEGNITNEIRVQMTFAVEKYLKDLEDIGTVIPSNTPSNSPL